MEPFGAIRTKDPCPEYNHRWDSMPQGVGASGFIDIFGVFRGN